MPARPSTADLENTSSKLLLTIVTVMILVNTVGMTCILTTTLIAISVMTFIMIETTVIADLCLHHLCQANAESWGRFLKLSCCQQHAQLMTLSIADSNT